MDKKIRDLIKDEELEKNIIELMENLDLEETEKLIYDFNEEDILLEGEEIQEIKNKVFHKVGIDANVGMVVNKEAAGKQEINKIDSAHQEKDIEKNTDIRQAKKYRNRFIAAAAAIALCMSIWNNGEAIVLAFQKMFRFIPGIGIVEDNQELLYRLEKQENVKNNQGELTIMSAVASTDEITVSFSFERLDFIEEDIIAEKKAEEALLKEGGNLQSPMIYLNIDGNGEKYYQKSWSSAGGGNIQHFTTTFEVDKEMVSSMNTYTLEYENYDIGVEFKLVSLEQYNNPSDIGATDIHNNISLTAVSSLEEGTLKVNIYPVNYSGYNLISFNYEYDAEYFGDKITLQTENGDKEYTLPSSYGSGMNAAYTFDVSDGSKDLRLHIPFVIMESTEEEKITLPIPKEGEIYEVNQQVTFEDGTVTIVSVEKVVEDSGNPYGDLRVNLSYESKNKNQQLTGIKLTREKSEGWSEEYDEQGRLIAINYMLQKSDKNKLKLKVVKPRYVFIDEYNLALDIQQ